jgi:hypothetical protein
MTDTIRRSSVALAVVCLVVGPAPRAWAAEEADNQLVDLVVGLLADQDQDVRALALEQIRTEAKGKAATERFAAQLAKLSPEAQVALLRALADRGDPAAHGEVVKLLAASQEESVRVAAIGAVGALGSAADTVRLIGLLSAESTAEQAAARASLVRLPGRSAAAAIAAEIKSASPALRVTLIEILQDRSASETASEILSQATVDDAAVRVAAMKALGAMAGAEHIEGMVAGVLKAEEGAERAAAEKAIMFVCARIPNSDERSAPLLSAFEKLDPASRTLLLSTLGRVGGTAGLKLIEKAIADPATHDAGIRALCNWPDASVAGRLAELARSDEHPADRIRALRALLRVAPLSDGRSDEAKLNLLKQGLAMATRNEERLLALDRARAIRIVETLRFLLPYLDQPDYAEQASLSIVELAHHRGLREPHKVEFHKALDAVIATSKDATVIDRARRYKKDETWVRPKK